MNKIITLLSLIAVIGLFSCTNNPDDVNMRPATANIEFTFSHYVGSQPLQFNSIAYTNAFGNPYSVETLKYFISDITLHQPDGGLIFFDEEHYVDGQDATTLVFNPGISIPKGDYVMISFVFGLNEEKNVSGAYPNPPESNMEWPPAMGPGYHYMKLEGKFDSTGVVKNYQAHTGATNGNQNYIQVSLPNSGFNLSGSTVSIDIKMNINNWWVSPNTIDLNDVTMIMGDQGMQVQLHNNGLEDVFSILSIQ